MTQEEKQLLLKDLSARLPYEVICKVVANDNPWIGDCKLLSYWLDKVTDVCYEIKPYLRPMSSMTDEEKQEWYRQSHVDYEPEYKTDPTLSLDNCHLSIDWLNVNHFDYRGLIPMGLALEASKNMYNYG